MRWLKRWTSALSMALILVGPRGVEAQDDWVGALEGGAYASIDSDVRQLPFRTDVTLTVTSSGWVRGRLVPGDSVWLMDPEEETRLIYRTTVDRTTTFRFWVFDAQGDSVMADAVTIGVVSPPEPTVSLAARSLPVRLVPGDSLEIQAETQNADSLVLTSSDGLRRSSRGDGLRIPLLDGDALSGDGADSTVFVLTAYGAGNQETADTVPVRLLRSPMADLEVTRRDGSAEGVIPPGSSISLDLRGAYGDSAWFSEAGRPRTRVSLDTTITRTPRETTTYTFEVRGILGSAVATRTVLVHAPPTAEITPRPHPQDSLILGIRVTGAETASVFQGDSLVHDLGVPSDGGAYEEALPVPLPDTTRTYVLRAVGPGGSVSDTTVVFSRGRGFGRFWSFRTGVASMALLDEPTFAGPAGAAMSLVFGERLYVTAQGGFRWGLGPSGVDPVFPSSPRPEYGDRTQRMFSLGLTYFPTTWVLGGTKIGLSLSEVWSWEFAKEGDTEWLARSRGGAFGVRVRPAEVPCLIFTGPANRHQCELLVGVDTQISSVNEFDAASSRGTVGLTLSVSYSYIWR